MDGKRDALLRDEKGSSSGAELLPSHHAAMFGIIARNARLACGEAGTRAVIRGLKGYALQRGRRMRRRADAHGDGPSMAAYRAYCEWAAPEGCIEASIERRSPSLVTRTTSCPWYNSWEELGLTEDGLLYCRYVDRYLLRGFNPGLKLGVSKSFSGGRLRYCQFTWDGLDFSAEVERSCASMRKRAEGYCVKGWEYHIGHLLSALSGELIRSLPEGEAIIGKSKQDFLSLFGEGLSFLFDGGGAADYERV